MKWGRAVGSEVVVLVSASSFCSWDVAWAEVVCEGCMCVWCSKW